MKLTADQATIKQNTKIVIWLAEQWATKTDAYAAAADPLMRCGETRKACAARLHSLSEMAQTELERRRQVRRNRTRRIKNFNEPKYVVVRNTFDGPPGGSLCEESFNLVDSSEQVRVVMGDAESRDRYSKSWHSSFGPARVKTRDWYTTRDWHTRVWRRNLAVVDGLYTMWAGRVYDAHPVYEVFRACWARHGRGHEYTAKWGYIARMGRDAYHGETAEQAIRGLRRKIETAALPDVRAEAEALLHRVIGGAAIPPEIAVLKIGLRESRQAGNCIDGTVEFAARLGLDPEDKTQRITVAELWGRIRAARLQEHDLNWVKQAAMAVLVAVRRSKRARNAVGRR